MIIIKEPRKKCKQQKDSIIKVKEYCPELLPKPTKKTEIITIDTGSVFNEW